MCQAFYLFPCYYKLGWRQDNSNLRKKETTDYSKLKKRISILIKGISLILIV